MTDSGPTPPENPSTTPPTTPPITPPVAAPTPVTPGAEATGPIYTGPAPTPDDKSMGMLAHLLGILGFIGPLIIWLIKKDTSPFVNDQGKEALNFQLMLLIGWVVGAVANLVFCVGILIWLAVIVVGVIFSIIGAMKAKEGIAYRYPFTIRFIK
jgi:uncharacterized Tic20 family protein